MSQFRIKTGLRKHQVAFLLVVSVLAGVSACLHRRGPAMILFQNNGKAMLRGDCPQGAEHCFPLNPVAPDEYVSSQYDQYQQSGFVSLRPEMRLRIVAPILRPGSQLPLATVQDKQQERPSLTAKASPDLLGYQTALYNLDADGSGKVIASLENINLQPAGKNNPNELTRTDYLKDITKPGFFRLYFQTRESPNDKMQALLVSSSQGKLNIASSEFEDSDRYCASAHQDVRCVAFPPGTAVNAEIKVHLKKQTIYLPLSATVNDALKAYGADDAKTIAARLRIERIWDYQLVPLQFERQSAAILKMPLMGGDRLSW